MKRVLKKDLLSFLFIASLIVLGGSIAIVLVTDNSEAEELGAKITAFSALLSSIVFYIELLKKHKSNISE